MRTNLVSEMQEMFGLPPRYWACVASMYLLRRWAINPIILQQALERIKHERVADGESLRDFIQRHYGEAAMELVERGIKGEMMA